MDLNPLLLRTETPPIPEVKQWAAGYSGQLGPLIDLSQAVPATPPPASMLDRFAAAAGSVEASRYGDITGDKDLLAAYAKHVTALYGGEIDPDELCITSGCNQAFFVAMILLAKAGDAVLLPSPWYFNHKMTLDMLGIDARLLPCAAEQGFVPDPERAVDLIDERVRAIILVSPNNPTGAIYPPEIIARFHALCLKKKITLVLDETYRDFIDPERGRPHAVLANTDWRESFVQLYSFSKAYCIPGHRVGVMLASKAAIAQTKKIMDSLQICTSRAPQMVLAWAIDALSDWRAANRREVLGKLSVFREAMAGVNDWSVDSSGAYFAYVRPPRSQMSDVDLARGLAEECGVLSLPGSFFGKSRESHLRVAFANVSETAIRALAPRLVSWSNRKA